MAEAAARSLSQDARPRSSALLVEGVEALPKDFVPLFEQRTLSFDQTSTWLALLAKHVLTSPRLLCIRDGGGEPAVVLPLALAPEGPRSGSRQYQSLANYYTAHFAPIAREDLTAPTQAALIVEHLGQLGPWHQLDLQPLARESALYEALVGRLRSAGYYVETFFRFGNWIYDTEGRTADEYLASLSSQLRNTLKRKGKAFAKLENASLSIARKAPALREALEGYEQVYAHSWKQAEPYPQFIREVIDQFGEKGWARVGIARVDGKAAAAQIWYVHNGVASIFKLAYHDDYAKLSVGSLLTMHMMREAMDVDGVSRIDYLCGDDGYKRQWMSARRERWGLRIHNPRALRGLVGASRASAANLASRVLTPLRRKLRARRAGADQDQAGE